MKVTKKWGDFADGTKIFAGVAEWALGVDNIDIAGLGIYDISNDYYNPSMTFRDTLIPQHYYKIFFLST